MSYAPSLSVLRHVLSRRQGGDSRRNDQPDRPRAAVFGDSRGNLPRAREEAILIAQRPGTTPLLGPDVTRERLLRAVGVASLVHVTGHGELSAADGFDTGLGLQEVQPVGRAARRGRHSGQGAAQVERGRRHQRGRRRVAQQGTHALAREPGLAELGCAPCNGGIVVVYGRPRVCEPGEACRGIGWG